MKGTKLTCEVNYLGVPLEVCGTYYQGTPDVPYLRNGDPGYPGDPSEFEISEVFISIDGHRVKGDDFLDNVGNLHREVSRTERRWTTADYPEIDSWKEVELLCIESIERGM